MEVNEPWLAALGELNATYPHRLGKSRRDGWGIAFYSKLPVAQLEVRELGMSGLPTVFAQLGGADGRLFYLMGTHPRAPVSYKHVVSRNDQLAELGKFAASLKGPLVLLGDLNATSWSPYFRDLLATSGLQDSRRGFGIQPTWPSSLGKFGITIDHVLISPDIAVRRRAVGPDFGSDHRAVIIDLVISDKD
jgi:endonuclease/exonuclease/phosphatase (EEP) superfamily protein YafD